MKKIIIICAMIFMTVSLVCAQGDATSEIEIDEMKELSPPPSAMESDFWQTGTIDMVRDDGLVINDMSFRWSRFGTRFLDKGGATLGASDFHEGMKVTVVVDNEFGEIVKLYRGEAQNPDAD